MPKVPERMAYRGYLLMPNNTYGVWYISQGNTPVGGEFQTLEDAKRYVDELKSFENPRKRTVTRSIKTLRGKRGKNPHVALTFEHEQGEVEKVFYVRFKDGQKYVHEMERGATMHFVTLGHRRCVLLTPNGNYPLWGKVDE